MSESLDLRFTRRVGYLKHTGEVLEEGQSVSEFRDI
jgi:hypothetical protein